MDETLKGLDGIFVYVDDILVASHSKQEHLILLRLMFEHLQHSGLAINLAKCEFGKPELNFLGHKITKHGVSPLPEKVEVINRFRRPDTVKGLQEFIGMVTFYHRFVPSAAKIMQPLYTALKGAPKTLNWTKEMKSAFSSTKLALANATMLVHPTVDSETALTVDASDLAIGGVLEQRIDGMWKPLAFFSKQLRAPEQKYSAFDRELLALHLAIRHFRYFLEGRVFTVYTDHKPLTFAFNKSSDPWSGRQQRHLAAISEYTTDVRHVAGKSNVVADALSRCQIAATHTLCTGINYSEMASAQRVDPEVTACRTAETNLRLVDVPFGPTGETLLCDVSRGQPRPLVPRSFRRRVFEAIHNLSHPSVRSSQKLVTSKFVWHNIRKDVGLLAKHCVNCLTTKIHTHVRAQ